MLTQSSSQPDTIHQNAAPSDDPTGTKTLRTRTTQNFSAKWRDVRGILRETVERNDALRLRETDHGHEFQPAPGALRPQTVEDFGTESDSERLARFRQWFRAVLDTHVLEPTDEERVRQGSHYSARGIRSGYARGIALANVDLRRSSLPDPDTGDEGTENPSDLIGHDRHQDALAALFLSVYGDIERAANETHTQVSRTLSDALGGVVLGDSTVEDLTTQLTGRVDAVGQTRTATTANTRIVEAVNDAIINRGVEAGVEQAGTAIEATVTGPHEGLPPGVDPEDAEPDDEPKEEWETAGDNRVCPRCEALGGQAWRISDIQAGRTPQIPQHPRCRCRWILAGYGIDRETSDESGGSGGISDVPVESTTPGLEPVDDILSKDTDLNERLNDLSDHVHENTAIEDTVNFSGLSESQARAYSKEALRLDADDQLEGLKALQAVKSGEIPEDTSGMYLINKDGTNSIALNPDASLSTRAKTHKGMDISSTKGPGSTLTHEAGHLRHHMDASDAFEAAENTGLPKRYKKRIADEVSIYGASSGPEFVAETYAGLRKGKTYSDEIMDWYDEYTDGEL